MKKMKEHELKTDTQVFQETWDGVKTFEVRNNDRDFEVGDNLYLRETRFSGEQMKYGAPLEYTGRIIRAKVTYILNGISYGLEEGWCIMSIRINDKFVLRNKLNSRGGK